MAEGEKQKQYDGASTTVTVEKEDQAARSPRVVLKLKKSDPDKKVKWDEGTVDNEHMNKKKSKCCCIYEKPKIFGQSSDEDDDDDDHDCTNHCRGHKSKKDYRHDHDHDHDHGSPDPSQSNQHSDKVQN